MQDPGGGTGWTVAVQFTDPGADEFEALTTNNFKRRLALVFDGEVEMAPLIQSPILGGRANLTMGNASPASQQRTALQLAIVLNSDALPAAVISVSEVRIP
jgi:preprotein translocase subunit SecD